MQKTLRGPIRDGCSLSVTTRSAASTNLEHAAGAVGVSGAPVLARPHLARMRSMILFSTSRLRPPRRCQGARVPARVCGGGQRRLRSRRSSLCAPPGARSPPHDAPETDPQKLMFIVYHPFAGGATTRPCASFHGRWRNFYLHGAPSSAARPGDARCGAARGLRLNGCGVTVSPRAAPWPHLSH